MTDQNTQCIKIDEMEAPEIKKGGKKRRRGREAAKIPKMPQEEIKYIPLDLIIEILSRLPTRNAVSCKSVCKSWLDLLAAPDFVKPHMSRLSEAEPCLAIFDSGTETNPYKVFEYVDIDEPNPNRRERRWNMVFNFDLPCDEPLYSSANGLLFLCNRGVMFSDVLRWEIERAVGPRNLFICNPVTRDYISLPCPHSLSAVYPLQMDTYGFGVSRKSEQYKVVRVYHGWLIETPVYRDLDEFMCQVYTLGTGTWRRIDTSGQQLKYEGNTVGAFLNGNIHWLARDAFESSIWISCFDLETETFSTFSPPPRCPRYEDEEYLDVSTCALGDKLCLCDNSGDGKIVIWLMKEYGDDKSWAKEFVIRKSIYLYGLVCPIKVYKNGDILMTMDDSSRLLYFSSSAQASRRVNVFGSKKDECVYAISYTPSLLPLTTFATENVTSY